MKPQNRHKQLNKTIASNLAAIMAKRGKSQQDIADMLGIRQQYVQLIMSEQRQLSFPDAIKICRELEVPLSTLAQEY